MRDPRIGLRISRRVDETAAVERARRKHAPPTDAAAFRKFAQLIAQRLMDDIDARRRLEQQPHFLRGLLATANHDDATAFEAKKDGECAHGLKSPARAGAACERSIR